MQELINIIKKTQSPIICVCNDRSSPKVRSLANYCVDVRFRKHTVQQVYVLPACSDCPKAQERIVNIARKEGFSVQPLAIQKVLESVNVDIRQALNLLQMWRSTSNNLTFAEP